MGKGVKIPINQKDKEWSGLLKVPDHIIISELRQKVGQLTSYIQELEGRLVSESSEVVHKRLLELQMENTSLRNSIKQLRRDLSKEKLDRRLAELKKENNTLRSKNGELVGKVVLLQEKLKVWEACI